MVEQKCVNIYCFKLHQLTTSEVGLTTMWHKCVVKTILWLECNNLKGKDHNWSTIIVNGIHRILNSNFVDGATQVSIQLFCGTHAPLELQLQNETSWRWKRNRKKRPQKKGRKWKRGKVTTAAAAPLLLACVVSHLVVPTRLLLSIETQKQNKTKKI